MIWNNVELFNVDHISARTDGAVRMFRFPKEATEVFGTEKYTYPMLVGRMTTGCEIRFVGEAADIYLSAENMDGTVEIYRGDFFCRIERLKMGVCSRIELRRTNVDSFDISEIKTNFSSNVWRIVFDHDFCGLIHDITPIRPIRPPHACEVPEKTLLAYGSSITQSSGTKYYSNSYMFTLGRLLGINVLNKGMGGSCFCEKEVGDYIATKSFDIVTLELAVNMIGKFSPEEYEKRAEYIVSRALETGKPVVMISHFSHWNDLPGAMNASINDEYIERYEKIYRKYRCENLYYISGREIVPDVSMLCADLIHPCDFGHFTMAHRMADKLRKEFKII